MKALFYAAGTSPASAFAIAPLASALRAAGHEVLVASFEEMSPAVLGVGLPPVVVARGHTTESIKAATDGRPAIEYPHEPDLEMPYLGHWFGRQGSHVVDDLVHVARLWGADVLVAGTLGHGAEVAARYLGVPFVRQSWDVFDIHGYEQYVTEEMADHLAELGCTDLPEPDLQIDICPPSLARTSAVTMRWTPHNRPCRVEDWMLHSPDNGRICLTMGSFRYADPRVMNRVLDLLAALVGTGPEIVVAIGEEKADAIRERFPAVRAGWIPLEFILPACDVLIHPAGGLTAINAINTATPQLLLNPFAAFVPTLRRLTDQGSARSLYREEGSPAAVARVTAEMLSDPRYALRARELADDALTARTAAGVVAQVEQVVAASSKAVPAC
ncbi:nucleotide disphospho-sugar-binding domain-containing protein [Amycolatopsis sp. cmx-4-83]|uniref:nucleotide disphospho-sugar-binding domain-containing protein n=1 Tax=Amycolatopsis sp. cmx-4-83 TaxID=2790940 RepID=UPI00397966F3